MKKLVVALVLAGGVTAVAFAALKSVSSSKKETRTEKKAEKKKKECKHTCMFSA
jgi:flagellar basal body-associated protein FliL